VPRIAPRVALIGTLVYMLIVVAVLVVPASAPHVRRGFLLDIAGGRRLAIDVVLNVAIFIPIGWGLRRASQGLGTTVSAPMPRVVVLAAAFSLAMEAVQAWLPNRYSSLADVIANTIGATVGAWMESRFRRRV
jgi:glycopeptide antibiotics resistance protein